MKRVERFGLLLTTDEKRAVELLAHAEDDIPQAALVRLLIRREAKRLGFWPVKSANPADLAHEPPTQEVCHA